MEKTLIQRNAQRGRFLRGLRKVHGWLGLWGAVLGLLFGLTGVLLNHRAVMKIPASQMEDSQIQLPVTQPHPANEKEFSRFVQQALDIRQDPIKRKPKKDSKDDKERNASFMGKDVKQPAIWKVEFQLPQAAIEAEYIPGNQFAKVERHDANIWGFLMRMHKGTGLNTAWILLADSIAGALMLLSITGVLLWTKMRGSRLAMAGLMSGSITLAVLFTLQSL